jgi:phthiodiolone/phenolphthiodiolone dimycocerosates ketoreductase
MTSRVALDNPLMRWMAGVFGRMDLSARDGEGIAPPLRRDWDYTVKPFPVTSTESEFQGLLSRTTQHGAAADMAPSG